MKVKLIVEGVDGEVLDVQNWSSTAISSRGGGGYLSHGTGFINAPSISSHTTEHRQLMFRTTAGDEREIDLDSGVGFHEGSRVRVVYVKLEAVNVGVAVSVTNLDTGAYVENPSRAEQLLLSAFPPKTIAQIKEKGEGFIVGGGVMWLLWIITLLMIVMFPLALAMIVYSFWRGAALKRRAREISQAWQDRRAALHAAIASVRTEGGSATFDV